MSCLFDALSAHLGGLTAARIRHRVCDYLDRGGPVLDGLATRHVIDAQYTRRMRLCHTWGGATEIQAFCNEFRSTVHVHCTRPADHGAVIKFVPVTRVPVLRTFVLTWNGYHYEARGRPDRARHQNHARAGSDAKTRGHRHK